LAGVVPFYYGYAMLPMATLALVATSPGQTFLIGVLNEPVTANLAISPERFNACYALASFFAAWPIMFIGALQDRIGIRRTMLLAVLGLGATLWAASLVSGLIGLFLALFFLRAFGQGALSMLANNTLAMWFHRRLGTFIGVQEVAMAGAIGLLPLLCQKLIEAVGWREALIVQAAVLWWIMLPVLLLGFRNRPEDVGQRIDDRTPTPERLPPPATDHADSAQSDARTDRGPTPEDQTDDEEGPSLDLSQAVRTPAYWITAIGTGCWGLTATAILLNLVPILGAQDGAGLSQKAALATMTTFAACVAVAQLTSGFLADRLPLRWLMGGAFAACATALGLLALAGNVWVAHAYAACFGLAQGSLIITIHTLWPRYYGRTHLGKIRGSVWSLIVGLCAAGPMLVAGSLWLFGGYRPLLWVLAGMFVVLAVVSRWARPPRRE
jgi:MFS family permease